LVEGFSLPPGLSVPSLGRRFVPVELAIEKTLPKEHRVAA